jgi:hypothetical protein
MWTLAFYELCDGKAALVYRVSTSTRLDGSRHLEDLLHDLRALLKFAKGKKELPFYASLTDRRLDSQPIDFQGLPPLP